MQIKNQSIVHNICVVSVKVLLILDQYRGVIQFVINVLNVLMLFVVMACVGIMFHVHTVLLKK